MCTPDFKAPAAPATAPPPPIPGATNIKRRRPKLAAQNPGAFSLRLPRNEGTGLKP